MSSPEAKSHGHVYTAIDAVCSRYSDADSAAPRIVSLDEVFAGVDEETSGICLNF